MENERENSGLLRYLKGNTDFEFFNDPLEDRQAMFSLDLAPIARDAMTYTAQRRTAALPMELRLKVMEAGVSYHASSVDISQVGEGASYLFDGECMKHTDVAAYNVLKEATQEALLKTAMFHMYLDFRQPDRAIVSSLPESVNTHVRYLHVHICLSDSKNYEPYLDKVSKLWDTIKLRLPNLKTCVLTLKMRTSAESHLHLESSQHSIHFINVDTVPFPRSLDVCTVMKLTCAGFLSDFAERQPAGRCFARFLHEQYDGSTDTWKRHYGPLTRVHHAEAEDRTEFQTKVFDLIAAIFRHARTSEENHI